MPPRLSCNTTNKCTTPGDDGAVHVVVANSAGSSSLRPVFAELIVPSLASHDTVIASVCVTSFCAAGSSTGKDSTESAVQPAASVTTLPAGMASSATGAPPANATSCVSDGLRFDVYSAA